MSDPTFVILYVNNPRSSTDFYTALLGKPPPEGSAMFAFFGIEFRRDDARYREWTTRGLRIAQAPTAMDFGHTFVALDSDEHRLRVFAPNA